MSLNTQTGITTSIKVSPGNESDNGYFLPLLKKDRRVGVKPSVYTGDKGYDDGNIHTYLKDHNLGDAVRLKETRTNSKTVENNEYWQKVKDDRRYTEGLSQRYKVERVFGDGKVKHHLNRSRYRGLKNFGIQAYLTFASINLKRIIKILTQVSMRNEVYVYAEAVT